MNYEEMSDFEINKRVALIVYSDLKIESIIQREHKLKSINRQALIKYSDSCVRERFDPCNDPSDAWPIIVENRISIENDWNRIEIWMARIYRCNHQGFPVYDNHSESENPLRAAMICFLKMKDAEKN
jgi:hypothetical protein